MVIRLGNKSLQLKLQYEFARSKCRDLYHNTLQVVQAHKRQICNIFTLHKRV